MMWRVVVVGVAVTGLVACGNKKSSGEPPPLSEAEQSRAVECAAAIVGVASSRAKPGERPAVITLARGCADACPAFSRLAQRGPGESHVALGAACNPECPAAKTVPEAPVATYWHRLGTACGDARYGTPGTAKLLTVDWFVLARSASYLGGVLPRVRGKARAQVDLVARAVGPPRPSLPAVVDGMYVAPPSRLAREATQLWVIVVGELGGRVAVASWARSISSITGSLFVLPTWQLSAPVMPRAVRWGDGTAPSAVVVAASQSAELSGLAAVAASPSARGMVHVGVALPRGVLGIHPVSLAPSPKAAPDALSTIIMDGDALYVASRKLPAGKGGHDWASARMLLGASAKRGLAVQLRRGATMTHVVRMLDVAHGLGHASVRVIPTQEPLATGVDEVSPASVIAIPGPPKVEAGLHVAQVATALRSARPALRVCYASQLAGKPNLRGTAVARLQILPSGKTAAVNVRGVDHAVSRCAARVLRGLAFPSPRKGKVTATFPISFERKAK